MSVNDYLAKGLNRKLTEKFFYEMDEGFLISNMVVFREICRVQQRDMAKFLNVAQSTLSLWEANINYPKRDNVLAIRKVFAKLFIDVQPAFSFPLVYGYFDDTSGFDYMRPSGKKSFNALDGNNRWLVSKIVERLDGENPVTLRTHFSPVDVVASILNVVYGVKVIWFNPSPAVLLTDIQKRYSDLTMKPYSLNNEDKFIKDLELFLEKEQSSFNTWFVFSKPFNLEETIKIRNRILKLAEKGFNVLIIEDLSVKEDSFILGNELVLIEDKGLV